MSPPTKSPSPSKKSDNATTKIDAVTTKEEKVAATETVATNDKVVVTKVEKVTTKEEKIVSKSGEDVVVKDAPSKDPPAQGEDTAEKPETTTEDNQPASPVKGGGELCRWCGERQGGHFRSTRACGQESKDFAEMLSKILDHEGSTRRDLAQEIEAALFERFKESNDDYLTQARIIIFGLKENEPMRERLYSGALHCLEFAYADDAFFKAE
ncbi:Transcription elongation factor S-II, central domain [Phytophthora cinnamomi]|uniref:Transcription elongation factor S-II, central domain n=1 Tax=Phytophthora cinnamomi TaxID=4785 RepID=UPI00355A2CF8|nr:Transcription elongation factor S-II, central domain [Phytophthora cinnamomi]